MDATHRLFAVDGAGLILVDPDQLLRNAAVSDERVGSPDLAAERRWPDFSATRRP